jgi:hypothetical protein
VLARYDNGVLVGVFGGSSQVGRGKNMLGLFGRELRHSTVQVSEVG